MKTHTLEQQIGQLLRDDYTPEQVAGLIDLPAEQVIQVIKQREQQKSKASNQHNQAVYAMSL